jgi:trehalose-6-phosphate synthase
MWRHVVYVPKSFNNISRNFIFFIYRPRDMQEYIFMFSIALVWTVNSICDHQISNWYREIFKYNTVIS